MKKKGFTLVELLVVIAIIALLMGILMPALARVRALAMRVVCGTHLSATGKAMMLYANEHEGKYVRAGGRDSRWGPLPNPPAGWSAVPQSGEPGAFGNPPGRSATIGSCFFYLIRYADSTPKIFLCGGDTATEFKLSDPDYRNDAPRINNDLTEAWDFGPTQDQTGPRANGSPHRHYSYSYQCPFGAPGTLGYFPLTGMSDPGMAIMADRNPYLALQVDSTWQKYVWRGLLNGSRDTEKWGNSPNHKGEGQNVLFNDGHVTFSELPYCGVDDDNIYSMAIATRAVEVGIEPWDPFTATVLPQSKIDSVLINEGVKTSPNGGIALSGAPPVE